MKQLLLFAMIALFISPAFISYDEVKEQNPTVNYFLQGEGVYYKGIELDGVKVDINIYVVCDTTKPDTLRFKQL